MDENGDMIKVLCFGILLLISAVGFLPLVLIRVFIASLIKVNAWAVVIINSFLADKK
jgi:hypothetical protein